MPQCTHVPLSVLLGASDNGRRAAAELLLWEGGKRLSAATQGTSFLTKEFFWKITNNEQAEGSRWQNV